jgi:16S rRNA (guanine527-N7)-methyltransferase
MTRSEGGRPDDWVGAVLDGWRRGQRLSAVGPGDVSEHLDHARSLARHLGAPGRALDLGTGIGIPGLALAGFLPATRWTLLDGARRRIRLVADIVDELGWADRIEVVHERAEVAGRQPDLRGGFDVVIARSFGSPAVTAECAAPFVRLGGTVMVSEPPGATTDRWPEDGLAELGLARGPAIARPHAQVLVAVTPVSDRFPRRPGRATKHPLW